MKTKKLKTSNSDELFIAELLIAELLSKSEPFKKASKGEPFITVINTPRGYTSSAVTGRYPRHSSWGTFKDYK